MVVSCSCCNDKSLFAQLAAVIVMADDAVCSSEVEGDVDAVVAISWVLLLFGKQCGEGRGGCCNDVDGGCFCKDEDDCFGFADGEELMVV